MSENSRKAEIDRLLDKALFSTEKSDGISAVKKLATYKQDALSELFEITVNDFVNTRIKQAAASEIEKIERGLI